MATATGKSRCTTCGKEKAILKCGGCTQDFCYNHFGDHRQQLNTQLEEIEINRDIFRQTLSEQIEEPQKHSLVQQIDRWEHDSISKIRQAAQEARQMLYQNSTKHIKQIEVKLNKLTDLLRQAREENDFVETDLRQWTEQITQLTNELNKPSNISLQQDITKPLVTKLYAKIETEPLTISKSNRNAIWIQNGVTVAGGKGQGSGLNQLFYPIGIYVDDDRTIYISDFRNHRIVEWKSDATSGKVVAGGNGYGVRTDQLNGPADVILDKKTNSLIICDRENRRVMRWPRQNGASGEIIISNIDCSHLTMDGDGFLYVSDEENHEVRRWRIGDSAGTVVSGGNGKGGRLDQLSKPTSIFVDEEQTVYVSDWENNRVMKWLKNAREGVVVAGGQGSGNGLAQLSYPQGVVVDQLSTVYVADFQNNRVMRWCKGVTQGAIVVGGNGAGEEPNQLNYPQGLSFDRQGNLYVVDQFNHRVQKFNIHPNSTFQ